LAESQSDPDSPSGELAKDVRRRRTDPLVLAELQSDPDSPSGELAWTRDHDGHSHSLVLPPLLFFLEPTTPVTHHAITRHAGGLCNIHALRGLCDMLKYNDYVDRHPRRLLSSCTTATPLSPHPKTTPEAIIRPSALGHLYPIQLTHPRASVGTAPARRRHLLWPTSAYGDLMALLMVPTRSGPCTGTTHYA
jgi:hypothetical protein